MDLLTTFNLTQAVSQPTHDKGHILDWLLHTSDDHLVQSTSVSNPSRHNVSFASICITDPGGSYWARSVTFESSDEGESEEPVDSFRRSIHWDTFETKLFLSMIYAVMGQRVGGETERKSKKENIKL